MYKPVWTINKTTKQSLILKQKKWMHKIPSTNWISSFFPVTCEVHPLKCTWLHLWNNTINWCVLEIEKHLKIFLNLHSFSCITYTIILFFGKMYSNTVKNYLLMKKSTRHFEWNTQRGNSHDKVNFLLTVKIMNTANCKRNSMHFKVVSHIYMYTIFASQERFLLEL